MDGTWPAVVVKLGGMNDSPDGNPENAALLLEVSRDRDGAWSAAPATVSIFTDLLVDPFVAADLDVVETIFWWSQHSGNRQWLVWEQVDVTKGCDLVYFDGSAKAWQVIETGRTFQPVPWCRTSYAASSGWLYYLNGYDEPQRWDGTRRARIGFDRVPPVPRVAEMAITVRTAAVDGITVTTSTHGWAVSYVNDVGSESPTSATVFLTQTVTPGISVDLSGTRPAVRVSVEDAPAHVKAIRVWRTTELAFPGVGVTAAELVDAPLFLLFEAHGGAGFVLADTDDDSRLGHELDRDALGLFPAGAKTLATFKGTHFVCGMPEYPTRLAYSAPLFTEQYPPGNTFDLGRDGGELRGLYGTRNALVAFSTRGIYLIKGDPVRGFTGETLTEDRGCVSGRAICEVPGRGLLFVSLDGLFLVEGTLENTGTETRIVDLTGPLEETWRKRINTAALLNASVIVHHARQEIWVNVPTGGRLRPDLQLIYHYPTGAWSTRQRPVMAMAESGDHRGILFLGMHTEETASGLTASPIGVHWYTGGAPLPIQADIRSGWLANDGFERTLFTGVSFFGTAYGNRSLIVTYRMGQRVGFIATETVTEKDPEGPDRDAWGTGLWGPQYRWGDYPTLALPKVSLHLELSAQVQLRIRGQRFSLYRMGLDAAPKRATMGIPPFGQREGG